MMAASEALYSTDMCLRTCRLLRNRVSAQQARERKKSYVSNIENTNKEQAQRVRWRLGLFCEVSQVGLSASVLMALLALLSSCFALWMSTVDSQL